MANFLDSHEDTRTEIVKPIISYQDFINFGAASTTCWSVTAKENFGRYRQLPWLRDNNGYRRFFSFSNRNYLELPLPEASGKSYFSLEGWLITLAEDKTMNLLHPLNQNRIMLPYLSQNYHQHSHVNLIKKAVLSSSPSWNSNYITMIIVGFAKRRMKHLAFARAGDNTWTMIAEKQPYIDVTYYQGRFYAITSSGVLVVCDVEGPNPTETELVTSFVYQMNDCFYIVVGSSGQLFVVKRNSQVFEVFKVNVSSTEAVKVRSLGDTALFLGFTTSLSIKASRFDGCNANCIYFVDDGKDLFVYNYLNGHIDKLSTDQHFDFNWPPLWVEVEPTC